MLNDYDDNDVLVHGIFFFIQVHLSGNLTDSREIISRVSLNTSHIIQFLSDTETKQISV